MKKGYFFLVLFLAACQTGGELSKGTEVEDVVVEQKIESGSAFEGERIDLGAVPKYFQNGDIKYFGYAEEVDPQDLMQPFEKELLDFLYAKGKLNWDEVRANFRWYRVGTVGDDYDFFTLSLPCRDMCIHSDVDHFLYDRKKKELLYIPVDENIDSDLAFLYANQTKMTFNNLGLPQTIDYNGYTLQNGDMIASLGDFNQNGMYPNQSYSQFFGQLAFDDDQYGRFYLTDASCLTFASPDGVIYQVAFEPFDTIYNREKLIWYDNSTGDLAEYQPSVGGGCGFSWGCHDLVSAMESDLIAVGEARLEVLYILKNPVFDSNQASDYYYGEDTGLTEAQLVFARAYIGYGSRFGDWTGQDALQKMTFEQFVASKPILFFRDPFGRWQYLQNKDTTPLAECGKPVIYLYPEKSEDISVQVDIDKLTVSDPAYGKNGWLVKASPDGKLYNYADGRFYPYLFWEGIKKGISLDLNRGFVVESGELDQFFDNSLNELGFTAQEKADFVEFWIPEMMKKQSPYYFVSFVGTEQFNKVAPLRIDPAPDTLIRVFMYYEALDKAVKVLPQKLQSFPREGFTVFEWGGTL